jgi:hypothetical protein
MKILFICGSLEPGRDGVGDYTRRLAGELIRQGHQTAIVALHDKSAVNISEDYQETGEITIPVLRLPFCTIAKIRYARVATYVDSYNPDFLSLQYVPFSFHKKGLPFGLATSLAKIGKGRKWHIMFHELWVGMDSEAPVKHRLWGVVQQFIIRKMLIELCPKGIHTQSLLYKKQLNKLGFQVLHLPLFGNIPVIGAKNAQLNKNIKTLTFVVFGSIHPGAPIKQFATELVCYGQKNHLNVQFIFIGRSGTELDNWLAILAKKGIEVTVLGEQNPEKISAILQHADWGVSSTPMLQIEKSGTVAAMREHGLNVICIARDWTPKKLKILTSIEGIFEFKENRLEAILNYEELNYSKVLLKDIANELINNLGMNQ